MKSNTNPPRPWNSLSVTVQLLFAFVWLVATPASAQTQPTQATTVPLLLPAGLCYSSAGDLFFAETARHVLRKVTPAGVLTTVAGTGVQGFGGDGGPAVMALLDSPGAVAVDPAGDVFFADVHNHRIRRVDASTGMITTVAGTGIAGRGANGTVATAAQLDLPAALAVDGNGDLFFADAATHLVRRVDHLTGILTTVAGSGVQGYSGDGGPALAALIDTPSGLAVDLGGNLYLADTHNQRVRRVDAATGVITSVAGTGQPGFSGDGGSAGSSAVRLPRGVSLDAGGNLYIADSSNQRVRRIDAVTGTIATIAGDGTQAYAGDANAAVTASLDSPGGVTVSPDASLPTVSDTANGRVRQVDTAAVIHTLAGLGGGGSTGTNTLTLSAPTVVLYGTGAVSATLSASAATGPVTFFDMVGGATQTLGSVTLLANAASFSLAQLRAGPHRLAATYAGDSSHAAAQSSTMSLTTAPAPVSVTPTPVNILYGQPVPALTGTMDGVLPQDAGSVSLALTTTAGTLSGAAAYPISASLNGQAAANYTLTVAPSSVTVSKAPTLSTLAAASLAVHVAPSTSGVATGTVSLLDNNAPYASATLSASGDTTFSGAGLSLGSHTLTAVYAGNANLLPSSSAPAIVVVGPTLAADFSLAATGQTAVSVPSGSPATFAFAVAQINGALSSPIQLTASGLPTGATASFNPAYLPPSSGPTAFILTIQTAKVASWEPALRAKHLVLATLLPLIFVGVRRRHRFGSLMALAFACATLAGCGDRVNSAAGGSATNRTYNLTVLGTATSAAGTTLQHAVAVTLTLQ